MIQGLDSMRIYRTEAGLYIIDSDYVSGVTDPYDISFDPFIKFDHDFVGRARAEHASKSTTRRFVTLTVEGEGETGYGCAITENGKEVGVATSPVVSPRFGPITLASIDKDLATIGTEVLVEGREGKVAAFPIYDTEKTRPRS